MHRMEKAPETAKCGTGPATPGKVTRMAESAPCAPQELQNARRAHRGLEKSSTKEHLAPQKCTAAADGFAGGSKKITPDERSRCQRASGPASGREAGESAEPGKSPPAPRGPWARDPGRGVSSGGREMRCGYKRTDRPSQAALGGAGEPPAAPAPRAQRGSGAPSSLGCRHGPYSAPFAPRFGTGPPKGPRQGDKAPECAAAAGEAPPPALCQPVERQQLCGERVDFGLESLHVPMWKEATFGWGR